MRAAVPTERNQPSADELAELGGPYRPRYEIRRSRNTRGFILYEFDRKVGSYRRKGRSFSRLALEKRRQRLGSRTSRSEAEFEMFNALWLASVKARRPRLRGSQADEEKRQFFDEARVAVPWPYLWAEEQGQREKRAQDPRYLRVVRLLARRGDWKDLQGYERATLVAANLFRRSRPVEWRQFVKGDPLASDDNWNRVEGFYRRYIQPRVATYRAYVRRSPSLLEGGSAYLRGMLESSPS